MRTALLVSVMLFLLVEAQGIRVLQQEFTSAGHHKLHEEKESSLKKESGGVVGMSAAVICKDEHCSGRSRKLMIEIMYPSSTSAYSKCVKNSTGGTKMKPTPKHHLGSYEGFNGNEEILDVESLPVSEHGKVAQAERYPDIIDIAGMDYSPARRKPPIHN